MGLAYWCDLKGGGHAFDEREAIIVVWKDDFRYACRAHCMVAFSAVFHAARATGEADILLPDLRGAFTVRVTPGEVELPAPGRKSSGKRGQAEARRENTGLDKEQRDELPSDNTNAENLSDDEFRWRIDELRRIIEAGPSAGFHPDKRLSGRMVLCCDATEEGHAFDERDAITVNCKEKQENFCKEHRVSGFVAAFSAARSAGESGIHIASLDRSFTIQPKEQPQGGNGQSGETRKPERAEKPPQPRREPTRNYGGRA